jgi:5-methylcytosine-specific restriction endonuclease McrA
MISETLQNSQLKRCTKCGQEKAATLEFFLPEPRYSSLTARCRVCDRQACNDRHAANRETRNAKARETLAANRDQINARRRAARAENPELREADRLRCLTYAAQNRPAAAARSREWAANNRDRIDLNIARRQERLAAAGPGYTDQDVKAKLASQKGCCAYCGGVLQLSGKGMFHVDHVVPISKGGRNDPSNICCACDSCNRRKHDRLPEVFLTDLRRGL